MPGIMAWLTFRGSMCTNLLPWDRLSLPVNGSAPKFYKRTLLAGPGSGFTGKWAASPTLRMATDSSPGVMLLVFLFIFGLMKEIDS